MRLHLCKPLLAILLQEQSNMLQYAASTDSECTLTALASAVCWQSSRLDCIWRDAWSVSFSCWRLFWIQVGFVVSTRKYSLLQLLTESFSCALASSSSKSACLCVALLSAFAAERSFSFSLRTFFCALSVVWSEVREECGRCSRRYVP